ncbi:hypothetical protein [Actinacidiphila oryziradicis]|uniref:Uncharacterized protein n=1 Tax=Actinacidiphila oryziradicis TaxID=2571141 RepID=A0A4U0RX73_9ACTN|nr:hypothetical protein [Actinacidiphila oryziradicis]TKA00177.1 hypothetical protein FCI23_43350 [Actinacidiphila oryziradicis]
MIAVCSVAFLAVSLRFGGGGTKAALVATAFIVPVFGALFSPWIRVRRPPDARPKRRRGRRGHVRIGKGEEVKFWLSWSAEEPGAEEEDAEDEGKE